MCPKNDVLVASANRRLLANTIEPSVRSGQGSAARKTAESIEVPFRGLIHASSRNTVFPG